MKSLSLIHICQNSNLLHLALDIWQDQVFFQENAYPSGHFAAEILNISEETLQNLITYGGAISHQVETLAHANRGQFIALLPETRASLENMLTVLWRCPPYNLSLIHIYVWVSEINRRVNWTANNS